VSDHRRPALVLELRVRVLKFFIDEGDFAQKVVVELRCEDPADTLLAIVPLFQSFTVRLFECVRPLLGFVDRDRLMTRLKDRLLRGRSHFGNIPDSLPVVGGRQSRVRDVLEIVGLDVPIPCL
jgi:hypothetical protein